MKLLRSEAIIIKRAIEKGEREIVRTPNMSRKDLNTLVKKGALEKTGKFMYHITDAAVECINNYEEK